MPANRGDQPDWQPRPDFMPYERHGAHYTFVEPETQDEIRGWLENIGASALAVANQFVDPTVVAEIYDDMAVRIYEDVSGDYLPLGIAVLRQQYREMGLNQFCYQQHEDGTIETKAS